MSSNKILKDLHLEKIRRETPNKPAIYKKIETTPLKVDKAIGPDDAFSCSVCYTDGTSSGLVTPVCCSHKICLECYTRITILNKEKASCPECRTLYIKKNGEENDDIYADMPPLISSQELIASYLIENEILHLINNINRVTINYAHNQLN
jgi:hypothetical protein